MPKLGATSLFQVETAILQFNTIILYVLIIGVALFLLFIYFRNRYKLLKMLQGDGEETFEKMPRNVRQKRLKILFTSFPEVEKMFRWIEVELFTHRESEDIFIELQQEWCCEQTTEPAEAPCRSRPKTVRIVVEGTEHTYPDIEYSPQQYIGEEDMKLLGWALMERSRKLVPFRRYRMMIHKTRRSYCASSNMQFKWNNPEVTREDFSLEISKK